MYTREIRINSGLDKATLGKIVEAMLHDADILSVELTEDGSYFLVAIVAQDGQLAQAALTILDDRFNKINSSERYENWLFDIEYDFIKHEGDVVLSWSKQVKKLVSLIKFSSPQGTLDSFGSQATSLIVSLIRSKLVKRNSEKQFFIPEAIVKLFHNEDYEQFLTEANTSKIKRITQNGYLQLRFILSWYLENRDYAEKQLRHPD